MANQVSGNFGFDANSTVQSSGLPNFGVQSDSMFQNLVNTPLGVQFGFQNAIASTPFGVAQGAFGSSFGGSFLQQSPQSFQTQCSISQAQCEQLLTFLKGYVGVGLSICTQTSQVASVMALNTISTPLQTSTPVTLQSSLPSTSNSASWSSNFSVSLDAPNSAVSILNPTPLDDPNANTSIPNPISNYDSAIIPTDQPIQP
nr:hypothetical protein CFP56_35385 [Quercus suber]